MEYYYKVKWGYQNELLDLFLKNHYPILQKLVESGRVLSVKIVALSNHLSEDGRWDYRVTIFYNNPTLPTPANPDEYAIIKKLHPDHKTYDNEEQRRFELLLAHWDLP